MRIGIDIMGGDYTPQSSLKGCLNATSKLSDSTILYLYGNRDAILNTEWKNDVLNYLEKGKFVLINCTENIEMQDNPSEAIKSKTDSPIVKGLKAHRDGEIDAFVSAGNTGAMLVGSVLIMGKVTGLSRPTIGALYPLQTGYSFICDVGANMDCKPEHLRDFAVLGSIYMKTHFNVDKPRIALLNVGEEKGKGNQLAKDAYLLLEKTPGIHFIGNAEGRDINKHFADVYICDGFVGNILLKFGESFYDLFKKLTSEMGILKQFNFETYGGTPFLGINGNVIIGHGISNELAFENMLLKAQELVSSQLVSKIKNYFA